MFHWLSYPPPHMHESYNHLYILSDLRVMVSCYFELYTEFIVYNCIVSCIFPTNNFPCIIKNISLHLLVRTLLHDCCYTTQAKKKKKRFLLINLWGVRGLGWSEKTLKVVGKYFVNQRFIQTVLQVIQLTEFIYKFCTVIKSANSTHK